MVLLAIIYSFSLLLPAFAFTPGFPYASSKVRGVNLGGWLVLEPWITPSLFDNTGNSAIVDEWTFGKLQSKSTASAVLKSHWDTWITESDFAAIAAAGLNHVRLPIGYWAFEVGPGEPYIQGQLPYLTKAVTWARNHGLKLIVDLHGTELNLSCLFYIYRYRQVLREVKMGMSFVSFDLLSVLTV